MSDFPSCGWRGGGCVYPGPLDFVFIMAGLLLLIAASIWWVAKGIGPLKSVPAPSLDEDGSQVAPHPRRHYHFDDAHGDRIARTED